MRHSKKVRPIRKTERFFLVMEPDTLRLLVHAAAIERRSASDVVRTSLREYLARNAYDKEEYLGLALAAGIKPGGFVVGG